MCSVAYNICCVCVLVPFWAFFYRVRDAAAGWGGFRGSWGRRHFVAAPYLAFGSFVYEVLWSLGRICFV